MTKITENAVETFTIELLEKIGSQYIYAPCHSLDSKNLPTNQTNFLLYTENDGKVNVEVFLKDETVWLAQKALAELFCADRSVITKHLGNIFKDYELVENSVCEIIAHTASDGKKYKTRSVKSGVNERSINE